MLTRRLQVLLDEDRWRRLEERSSQSGASIGAIVRRALDDALPPTTPDPDAAAARLLAAGAGTGEQPDWSQAKRDMLDAAGDA